MKLLMSVNKSFELLWYLFLMKWNLYINILLKSRMHIPMSAGLLIVNITFLLRIVTKFLSSILCDIQLDFDVHFKQTFLLLASFTFLLFLKFFYCFSMFSVVYQSVQRFSIFVSIFCAFILFFVLNSIYGFNHCE